MSSTHHINAEIRTEHGKGHARRMRRELDRVPAVVYGGATAEAQSISLDHKEIFYALEDDAIMSTVLTLMVGKQSEQVMIKAVQRHPFKPKIVHVDFKRVSSKESVTIKLPIHIEGESNAPGVKQGGKLESLLHDVEVRCLASKLVDAVTVDVSKMALGDVLHLSDLVLPKGMTLLHADLDAAHNHAVVACRDVSSSDAPAEEDSSAEDAE